MAAEIARQHGDRNREKVTYHLLPPLFCGTFEAVDKRHKAKTAEGLDKFRGGVDPRVPLSLFFVCQTELTEFCAELTEFAGFSQNSPSLPQNSVSSLLQNSALETVFRPFLETYISLALFRAFQRPISRPENTHKGPSILRMLRRWNL